MRKIISLFLAALLVLGASSVPAETAAEPKTVTAKVAEIQKYGNMVLDVTGSDVLNAGFAYGDLVTVTILGKAYDMPIGSDYNEVDQGSMICRVAVNKDAVPPEDSAQIAVNLGDMAETAGVATREDIDQDPGYVWHLNPGVEDPVTVTIELKEAGAYVERLAVNQLVHSEKREDYPNLTDAQFANFREVTTTGMAEKRLYRSSSPVDPEIGRNKYADAASEAAGVKTFLNLADSEEVMRSYPGFADTYYSRQNIIAMNLSLDFTEPDFAAGLAEGIRFLLSHEGPYLVHCVEGKDRAGFVSAVLECLMGASAEEVIADYMVTFYNYYGVEPGTAQYNAIASAYICKSLAAAFGVDTIEGKDPAALAESYLLSIGLTGDEVAALKTALGK